MENGAIKRLYGTRYGQGDNRRRNLKAFPFRDKLTEDQEQVVAAVQATEKKKVRRHDNFVSFFPALSQGTFHGQGECGWAAQQSGVVSVYKRHILEYASFGYLASRVTVKVRYGD